MEDDQLNPLSPSDEGLDQEVEDQDLSSEEEGEDQPNRRSAEGRIAQLIAKNKETEEKLRQLEERITAPQPEPAYQPPEPQFVPDPEVQKAAALIKQMGFSTEDDLEEKMRVIESRMALNNDHQRFESELDGADGRPKYDRSKVEDFMRTREIWNPEIAYKLMYEQELLDWHVKQAESRQKERPSVIRSAGGGQSRGTNTITREKLEEVYKNPTPQNRAWYERNRGKILDLQSKGQL